MVDGFGRGKYRLSISNVYICGVEIIDNYNYRLSKLAKAQITDSLVKRSQFLPCYKRLLQLMPIKTNEEPTYR